ncbi:redox-regulated ATPase YchF [bacterium]|nr:redox-regulated ATPase YchF [bacterium]
MGLSCGIVGLPNVGKSTLFNALTSAGAEASNYPFCTIEPNKGIVKVPDLRLKSLAKIVNPERILPAVVEFLDIAGLVKGASSGEGLGNKFLGHIKETDLIVHVVRCFEDENIIHVNGSIDPIDDIEIIETELIFKDLETIENQLKKGNKAKGKDKENLVFIAEVKELLEQGKWLCNQDFNEDQLEVLRPLQLISMKKVLYMTNISEDDITEEDNQFVKLVRDRAESEGNLVVKICSTIESEIAELESDEEKEEFLEGLGLQESGLNSLIRTAYNLLGLQTYFTAGVQEVRAWTIKVGDTAPKGAGVIHTDFERGFIKAEVVSYDDFIACEGEAKAKESGKLRIEGKDYVLADGDVVHFRFNV